MALSRRLLPIPSTLRLPQDSCRAPELYSPQAKRTAIEIHERGAAMSIAAPPGYYSDPKLSPDDRRLAVAPNYGSHQDIWVHDFARGTWARVTTHPGFSTGPIWHPSDPNRLVFASVRPDRPGGALFSMPADGSAPPALVGQLPGPPSFQRSVPCRRRRRRSRIPSCPGPIAGC